MVMALMGPTGQMQDVTTGLRYGACDAAILQQPYGLDPFRYDSGLFTLTHAANDSTLAANQTLELFTIGNGQSMAANGFPAVNKTDVEGLLYDSGALAYRGENYRAEGVSLLVERPFIINGANQRSYPNWLDEYCERVQNAFLQGIAATLLFGKSKCEWSLGILGMWPQNSGAYGGQQTITNGSASAISVYLPFSSAVLGGAADEPDKLKLKLFTGNLGISVPDNTAQPAQADMKVPIRAILWGRRDMSGCQPVCLPPGIGQGQAQAALLQAIQNLSPQQAAALIAAAGGVKVPG
jgi:hypothetical protein